MKSAVVLIAHGTVERLDDLAPFITKIRRGHPAPASVVDEVRRRYEAIGGQSPLLETTRLLAKKVEALLGVPTRIAMRLWHPLPGQAIGELVGGGVNRIAVVPLAQFSASVYGDAIARAADEFGGSKKVEVVCTKNWGTDAGLVGAQAKRVQNAIDEIDAKDRENTLIVFSAHSLPQALIDAGDAYERDFRASVAAISERLGPDAPPHLIGFQSQGMAAPGERQVAWLGPDLTHALDEARARGMRHVIFAPTGFLADHVEILYDLDIEARAWAKQRGIETSRIESLNASDDFAEVIASLARPLLVS